MADTTQTIIFGGGCFWCVEAVFQRLRGVTSVTSGYAGGETTDPTYHGVSTGNTGHAEVVRIEYDSATIPLAVLLDVFFTSHDPTTLNRQGADVGTQYRSAVYYMNDEQKREVEDYIHKLEADKVFTNPIVTEVKPAGAFYEAEDYHRNYYNENKQAPYCQAVIAPKLTKLREHFQEYLSGPTDY